MSTRHKLGIALGAPLAVIVALSAIGVGSLYVTFRELGESFEQGFLGPPDERQRIEVADHRFAISFAGDWVVKMVPEQRTVDGSDVDRVLLAGPLGGVPRCRVDVLPGGRSLDAETTLLAWAADDALTDEYATSSALDPLEDVLGITLSGSDATEIAAYWVPHGDDALVVGCEIDLMADRPSTDDGVLASDGWAMLHFGMPALVRSIEPLATPSPGPTAVVFGPGRRVETPSGLMLTFPGGWTILEPDVSAEVWVVPGLTDLVWRRLAPLFAPWTPSSAMTAVRIARDHGLTPVESCTVDAMPTWYAGASLDEAAGLMLGEPANDGDPLPLTYLDVPMGRAARIDIDDDGDVVSTYLWSGGWRLHRLVCHGPASSRAEWDAIVASAEPAVVDG